MEEERPNYRPSIIKRILEGDSLNVSDIANDLNISKPTVSRFLHDIINKDEDYMISMFEKYGYTEEDYRKVRDYVNNAIVTRADREVVIKDEEEPIDNDEDVRILRDTIKITSTIPQKTVDEIIAYYKRYKDKIQDNPTLLSNVLSGKLGNDRATKIINTFNALMDKPIDNNQFISRRSTTNTMDELDIMMKRLMVMSMMKALNNDNNSIDNLIKLTQLTRNEVPITIKDGDKETTLNVSPQVAAVLTLQRQEPKNDNTLTLLVDILKPIIENALAPKESRHEELLEKLLEQQSKKEDSLDTLQKLRQALPELFNPPIESLEVAKLKMENDLRIAEMNQKIQQWYAEREDKREERMLQAKQMENYSSIVGNIVKEAAPILLGNIKQGMASVTKQDMTSVTKQDTQQTEKEIDYSSMTDEELDTLYEQYKSALNELEQTKNKINLNIASLQKTMQMKNNLPKEENKIAENTVKETKTEENIESNIEEGNIENKIEENIENTNGVIDAGETNS
ncbi:MAG: hypothetical protein QXO37_06960 [Candidatus Nitrosocaldaceae archaeon]